MNDLDRLIELREKLTDYYEIGDPPLLEYALQMVNDWIHELQPKAPR